MQSTYALPTLYRLMPKADQVTWCLRTSCKGVWSTFLVVLTHKKHVHLRSPDHRNCYRKRRITLFGAKTLALWGPLKSMRREPQSLLEIAIILPFNFSKCCITPGGDLRKGASQDYFGGVTAFTLRHLRAVNGYGNKYWGWGREDDNMRERLKTQWNVATRQALGSQKICSLLLPPYRTQESTGSKLPPSSPPLPPPPPTPHYWP